MDMNLEASVKYVQSELSTINRSIVLIFQKMAQIDLDVKALQQKSDNIVAQANQAFDALTTQMKSLESKCQGRASKEPLEVNTNGVNTEETPDVQQPDSAAA